MVSRAKLKDPGCHESFPVPYRRLLSPCPTEVFCDGSPPVCTYTIPPKAHGQTEKTPGMWHRRPKRPCAKPRPRANDQGVAQVRSCPVERLRIANIPGPYWLADLMSSYTVENMSFGPADSTDLERLLGTSLDTASMSSFSDRGGVGGIQQTLSS